MLLVAVAMSRSGAPLELPDRCSLQTRNVHFHASHRTALETPSNARAQLIASGRRVRDEILDVQIIVRSQQVRSTMDVADLKLLNVCISKLAQAKLSMQVAPVPSKHGAGKKIQ